MLATTRQINKCCQIAAYGKGRYVFCSTAEQEKLRITRAKTEKGTLKVRTLNSGRWVVPTKVWIE